MPQKPDPQTTQRAAPGSKTRPGSTRPPATTQATGTAARSDEATPPGQAAEKQLPGGGTGNGTNDYANVGSATTKQSGTASGPRNPKTGSFSGTGTGTGYDEQEERIRQELLDQFYAGLRVTYLAANPTTPETADQHARIRQLLADHDRSWQGAYEIEQLLVFIMSDEQVSTELPRRMAEAKALNLRYVAELEQQFKTTAESLKAQDATADKQAYARTRLRYILQRLLDDLQWFYNQRIRRHEAAKRLSLRVSALFLSGFFFFFSLLFIQYTTSPPNSAPAGKQHTPTENPTAPETKQVTQDTSTENQTAPETKQIGDSGKRGGVTRQGAEADTSITN